MSELALAPQTLQRVQQLFDTAAAKGGTVQCVKRDDGSLICYIKQDLLKKPHFLKRDTRDIVHQVLKGNPGPRRSSGTVLRVEMDARQHLEAQLPRLFLNPSAEFLARRQQA